MQSVGFIGLGIMGKPMVKNLLKGQCTVYVYDIDSAAVEELVLLGAHAADLGQIGGLCSVIFTALPNGAVVQNVLLGADGVAQGMQPGAVVVDVSSVTPEEAQTCAAALHKLGIGFVDAPMSGGEPKAIDGTLAFMCGGTEESFEAVLPYLLKMGASAVLVGGVGSGSVTKLANQIIVNLTIAAVSEAMVLAQKAGVDVEKVYQAIRGGLAGSAVLDAKAPMMMQRNFTPGGKISINHKDIKNVMSTAQQLTVPLPLSAQLFSILESLKATGHLEDDHSGIVQYYEAISGVTVQGGGN